MNRYQFKRVTKRAKVEAGEISGKLFRDRPVEKKERTQKIVGRIRGDYGECKDDFQGDGDIADDIRGYGDFRDDLQKSG